MVHTAILLSYFFMWHCLVLLAFLYCLSGLDDLFIDIYFWTRYWFRKRASHAPLLSALEEEQDEQWIAVLIPCWREATVIATMLQHNYHSIEYRRYYFFVGVYPNDPETTLEVLTLSQQLPQVQCVIGAHPGPTNKAANLNTIYQFTKLFEQQHQLTFGIYVFHDSEDIIHPLSFKLYHTLIPANDMVQIPVFPLAVAHRRFTHWLYADEFSENHTKDIIVRESIHAHVPSAGVGTAFSRRALSLLEAEQAGYPFSIDSLTEDYRTSLTLRLKGLKQVFIAHSVKRTHWKQRWFSRSRYVKKVIWEPIATRAWFPMSYKKSIRQKARWIMGIVFQEWDLTAWPRAWPLRYSLFHDRKGFITHFINGFGYIVLFFWIIYTAFASYHPAYPSLQEQFNFHPSVWMMVQLVSFLMIERLLQRMIAVYRIYGVRPALLCLPRAFYGNILNLHALMRAYWVYFSATSNKKKAAVPLVWDKTDHAFPGSHVLVPYRRRLGEWVKAHTSITEADIRAARLECERTGERLGAVLVRLNLMTQTCLSQLLSMQYQLQLYSKAQVTQSRLALQTQLPRTLRRKERQYGVNIVAFDASQRKVVLGIDDPTNELLLQKIIQGLAPHSVEFVLIGE